MKLTERKFQIAWVFVAILIAGASLILPGWSGGKSDIEKPVDTSAPSPPPIVTKPVVASTAKIVASQSKSDESEALPKSEAAKPAPIEQVVAKVEGTAPTKSDPPSAPAAEKTPESPAKSDAGNSGAAEVTEKAAEPPPTVPSIGPALEWSIEKNGALEIFCHGVLIVKSDFVFWGPGWKWTEAKRMIGPLVEGNGPARINVPGLGAEMTGKIIAQPDVVKYELELAISRDQNGAIGGGMEFFLEQAAAPLASLGQKKPELLPNGGGWKWEIAPGQPIELRFDPAPPKVYAERGQAGHIRAFFVDVDDKKATKRPIHMTLSLPKGAKRRVTEEEKYGPVQLSNWKLNAMPPGVAPVDLRFLNHVPGKHGFVKTDGDRFVFEDGTPARFWGTNIMAYALFASNEQIELHAQRLGKLGFNLARLHHHDTMEWVDPTVIDKAGDSSRTLSTRGMDRIDYWIKCLSENGIYVWLDLHSYRQFRPNDRATELGEVVTYAEIAEGNGKKYEGKGFVQYDPVLQKLMTEFQENYLSHVNAYTNKAYKDDPAVMGLLITNENDLTQHYGLRPVEKGNKNAALNKLFEERIALFEQKSGLNAGRMRQPWAPGPAKVFLNDQEHVFYTAMIDSLKKLNVKVPIAAGNMWGDNPFVSLPALTTGDVIDVHRYDGEGNLSTDPRFQSNMASWIGCAQVEGMPLTVSEWNFVTARELATDRFVAPLYAASIASLQGWDALMLYGYSQTPLKSGPHRAGIWDAINDPAIMALMPAAALAYRQQHVSPAKRSYCLTLTRQQLFNSVLTPDNCLAGRTLIEQSKFTVGMPETPELEWLKPRQPTGETIAVTNPRQSFLADDAQSVVSDTGQLDRNWKLGLQMINTPMTQAAHGRIGGHRIVLEDVTIEIQTPHAAVAVSSLDGKPIRESSKILVTAVARVHKDVSNQKNAGGDIYSEPVRGSVTIKGSAGLQIFPLAGDGVEGQRIESPAVSTAYHLSLTNSPATHWHLLRK
ncbi:MAG: hypothetical protein AB7O26_00415 [Planctomycetaceae bacterium]